MALSIRIYGTVDAFPSIDEIIDILEESDFEVTIETEDEDEDEWEELLVFESSLDGPIDLFRYTEPTDFENEIIELRGSLNGSNSEHCLFIRDVCENATIGFGIEMPEEFADDDNALLLCSLLAQMLVQKCDGFYCADGEGFFDDSGDLIFELTGD